MTDKPIAEVVPKLEPCPFCGSSRLHHSDDGCGGGGEFIQCLDCVAGGPVEIGPAAAIAAWNRRASGWQPISTAPRDGTWIMHYEENGPLSTGYMIDYYDVDSGGWNGNPTHWQPLPPAPEPTP
jgi:Lar family restriction alleviation protein